MRRKLSSPKTGGSREHNAAAGIQNSPSIAASKRQLQLWEPLAAELKYAAMGSSSARGAGKGGVSVLGEPDALHRLCLGLHRLGTLE